VLRGDCSIRTEGYGFSTEEIAACAQRQGLLAMELELGGPSQCDCPSCGEGSPRKPLSLEEIGTLVGHAKLLGCRRIILIDVEGGASPNRAGVIGLCRAEGLEIELFTSDASAACNVPEVAVSLEIHDLENPTDPLPDNVSAVRIAVTPDNLGGIPSAWRWARSRGIEPHVQVITPKGNGNGATVVSPAKSRQLFEELARIDRNEFDRSWAVSPGLIGRSCKRHLYACHVTACGTVYACVGLTIPLGNVRTEMLRDILVLSEVLENIRGFEGKVKEPCRTCSKSTDCYGCRGAAYQLTGDYLAADPLCWKNEGVAIDVLPVDAGAFIPHGPSIRMIDRLTAVGERTADVDATVPVNSLWTDGSGVLDELAYIEMIAQAFAASHGFHRWAHETADQQGLLLGIKDLRIESEARAGERLRISLRKVARFGDFGLVEGDIRHEDGSLVASGQLKVWRPGEEVKAMIS
jgi:radical SAM protein with 4Fe4S-binding SPASM domain